MKYLAIAALLLVVATAQHEVQISLVNGITAAFSHGFETGLYAQEADLSDNCAGDWADAILEELFSAVDDIQTETYDSMTTILKDAFFYSYQNFYFCDWNSVSADVHAFCLEHQDECNPVNVINKLVNEKDKYADFAADLKSRLVMPATLEELVENVHEIAYDLGSIAKIMLQFYV